MLQPSPLGLSAVLVNKSANLIPTRNRTAAEAIAHVLGIKSLGT